MTESSQTLFFYILARVLANCELTELSSCCQKTNQLLTCVVVEIFFTLISA